jgi:hypothetical protein
MEFTESKVSGDIIEEEVLKLIQKKYPQAYTTKHKGKFSDYDIFIPELNEGVEVKGDYMSAETGNIVVEVEMNNKPSALSVTKAKYWVFVEGYRMIWLEPIDIYRLIDQKAYRRAAFTGEGDTKEKHAYLVLHMHLVEHAKKYGKIMPIKEDSPIYYNNFSKRVELFENNYTKP